LATTVGSFEEFLNRVSQTSAFDKIHIDALNDIGLRPRFELTRLG